MLLVDTNVFLAAADRRSRHNGEVIELLRAHEGELAAPVPVLAETAWLVLDRLGTAAQGRFVDSVADGYVEAVNPTKQDWRRCAELLREYADLRLDLVDAAIVAVAERLRVTTIATWNHRDFRVVRPRHVHAFELLP